MARASFTFLTAALTESRAARAPAWVDITPAVRFKPEVPEVSTLRLIPSWSLLEFLQPMYMVRVAVSPAWMFLMEAWIILDWLLNWSALPRPAASSAALLTL